MSTSFTWLAQLTRGVWHNKITFIKEGYPIVGDLIKSPTLETHVTISWSEAWTFSSFHTILYFKLIGLYFYNWIIQSLVFTFQTCYWLFWMIVLRVDLLLILNDMIEYSLWHLLSEVLLAFFWQIISVPTRQASKWYWSNLAYSRQPSLKITIVPRGANIW